MEKLIIIAIIVIASMIHSWIKRKQEAGADESWPDPNVPPRRVPPRQSSGQSPAGNWEEELRRLLQGESPPPPIVQTESYQPVPPPIPSAPAVKPSYMARKSTPARLEGMEMEVGLPYHSVTFDQASSAHDRAVRSQSNVAQRIHDAGALAASFAAARPVARRGLNAGKVRNLFRDRESQRAAILASVILGAPRAMDQHQ